MAKQAIRVALTMLIVLAAFTCPAWAGIDPNLPIYKVDTARVGVEADGSTWTTTLWEMNVGAVGGGGMIMWCTDMTGTVAFPLQVTFADGHSGIGASMQGYGSYTNGVGRFVLNGLAPDFPATTFRINWQTRGGYAYLAVVQHTDKDGNFLSSDAYTDNSALRENQDTEFTVGYDVVPGVKNNVTLTSFADVSTNVTLSVYDGESMTYSDRPPLATATVVLDPRDVGSWLVGRLLDPAANPAFAAYLQQFNGVGVQLCLRISADQPIAVNTTLLNVGRNTTTPTLLPTFVIKPQSQPQQ